MVAVLGLLVLLFILINLPPVQRWMGHCAAAFLSNKLKTEVKVSDLRFHLLNQVELSGLTVLDRQGDTIIAAGSLNGKVTDWFVFKDNIRLEYLGLKDARICMKRDHVDAPWNFAFIIDAFRSDKPKQKKDQNPIDFDLDEIVLERVHFSKWDDTFGNGIDLQLKYIRILGDDIDLAQKRIALRSFKADGATFSVFKASTDRPWEPIPIPDLSTKTPFNPNSFAIDLASLELTNSRFVLDDLDIPVLPNQFDGRHIDVKGINIKAENINIRQDTLRADLNHLTGIDRSGIEIKRMKGKVRVDPTISEVSELYVETNRSILQDYFAMKYEQFPDFREFINRVKLSARLHHSKVSMDDIAYFAPALQRWSGAVFTGSLRGEGPVADLDVHDIDLKNDKLHFRGDYRMTGLPEIESTQIVYKNGFVQTTHPALLEYFPEIQKLNLEFLEGIHNVEFKGEVSGRYNALKIDGDLTTNAGTLHTEGLALDYSGIHFLYEGRIYSDNFNVAILFPDAQLGESSFEFFIKGNGFDYKSNDIALKGTLYAFPFKNYVYKESFIDAEIKDGTLQAKFTENDEHVQVDLDIVITHLDSLPNYDIVGKVDHLDLEALGLLNHSFRGSAIVDVHLSGTNGKNIAGIASMKNVTIEAFEDTFTYDSFTFTSHRSGLENFVRIETNNLQLSINGTFYLDELLASGQKFLANYLSEYVNEPSGYVPDQKFNFSIRAAEPDKLIHLFTHKLSIANGFEISGSMDGARQLMYLSGYIPYIKYNNLKAEKISISGHADLAQLVLNLHGKKISSNEKEMTSELDFTGALSGNKAVFDISTTGTSTFGTANINGTAIARNDSIQIMLNPSELIFNNQKWDILGNSKIVLFDQLLYVNNLQINSDQQIIEVNTPRHYASSQGKNLIYLQNINVKPILDMLGLEIVNLEGKVAGDIEVEGLPQKVEAQFNLIGQNLSTRGNALGQIKLVGNYSSVENKLVLLAPSGMYDSEGHITMQGTLRLDTASSNSVNFRAEGHNASLAWAEPFASELAKNFKGKLNGYIDFKGLFPTPNIDGKVQIVDGHFTPLVTGVDYWLPNAEIDINSTRFTIKDTEIKDEEGNVGILSGTITHQYFEGLNFSLRMVSDKIKVLDKKEGGEEEVDVFYGKVYAGVNLTLRGLLKDLNMNITARTAENSKLFIPLTSDADLETYDYISFKVDPIYGDSLKKQEKKTRLNITLDAIVTPNLEAEIIIDPVAGDKINAVGSGNLAMFIPSEGDIRLNGSYYIESGYYDFTFNSLQLLRYKNRFNLLSGSVINWDGKISDATVDVKANTIKRARLYDLITDDVMRGAVTFDNSGNERSDALTPQNIIIDMRMTGKLLNPDLQFKLDLEETRSIGTYAYQKLQRINQDDRDLVNQVLSLLVLNQFLPMEGVNSNVAVNTGVSNVAEVISTFASSQLTNFTNKVLGIEDLWINLRYKNYNITDEVTSGNLHYLNRNEAGVSVRKNFFNDRLVIDIGGVYDWGTGSRASNSNYTTNLTGDFRLDYLLTPDGKLRLNIFRNSSFDAISLQNIGRHGVGFTYRKSFNDIYELFGIQRKSSTTNTTPTAPAPLQEVLPPANKLDTLLISDSTANVAMDPQL